MRDPTKTAANEGTIAIEAAPVIKAGLGASASSAPNTADIITIIIITPKFRALVLCAAPAISTPFYQRPQMRRTRSATL
ncbi:hypothetical protein SUGI_0015650 [Cryptomeria japonica]|nr:hypothetical protein SUGI_0015650 [Cryptomeria japonica]